MQKRTLSYATGIFESAQFTAGSEFIGTQWDANSGLQNQPEKRLMLAILLDASNATRNMRHCIAESPIACSRLLQNGFLKTITNGLFRSSIYATPLE
jgi:hypothetical protein